jgi:hypothetical protein
LKIVQDVQTVPGVQIVELSADKTNSNRNPANQPYLAAGLCAILKRPVSSWLGSVKQLWLAVLFTLSSKALAAESLPTDVQSFIDTRQACDHFRGEPWNPGDEPEIKARREFIFESIMKYCTGTDKRLRELRNKYRDNPKIVERLREYEDRIESQ